jgi:HSP20 family protein
MSNVQRLPALWSGLNRLSGEVDRLFERWGPEVVTRHLGLGAFPPVNVWEDENAFDVEAELPGLKQEQLHISVANRTELTIQGERSADERLKGTWHRRERGFGKFQRALTLPVPVDPDKVEARLENGVLHLTLPKAEEARPRRITVKAE